MFLKLLSDRDGYVCLLTEALLFSRPKSFYSLVTHSKTKFLTYCTCNKLKIFRDKPQNWVSGTSNGILVMYGKITQRKKTHLLSLDLQDA